jgi:hypothetical protein
LRTPGHGHVPDWIAIVIGDENDEWFRERLPGQTALIVSIQYLYAGCYAAGMGGWVATLERGQRYQSN